MQITSTNNYRYEDGELKSLRVYYQDRFDEEELRETLTGSVNLDGNKYEGKTHTEVLESVNAKRDEIKGAESIQIEQTNKHRYSDDELVSLRVYYQERVDIDDLRETLNGDVTLDGDQYEGKTQDEVLQAVQDKRDEIKGAE